MEHMVERLEITFRSSEKPQIIEFKTEDEMNTKYQELIQSQYNDPESSDMTSIKRTSIQRDNNPQGVTKDISLVAVLITRKLFLPVANKTMLSMEEVANKIAVLAMQTNAILTEKRLTITEENAVAEATKILFISHDIQI